MRAGFTIFPSLMTWVVAAWKCNASTASWAGRYRLPDLPGGILRNSLNGPKIDGRCSIHRDHVVKLFNLLVGHHPAKSCHGRKVISTDRCGQMGNRRRKHRPVRRQTVTPSSYNSLTLACRGRGCGSVIKCNAGTAQNTGKTIDERPGYRLIARRMVGQRAALPVTSDCLYRHHFQRPYNGILRHYLSYIDTSLSNSGARSKQVLT